MQKPEIPNFDFFCFESFVNKQRAHFGGKNQELRQNNPNAAVSAVCTAKRTGCLERCLERELIVQRSRITLGFDEVTVRD